jgi:hypothetical protein
MERRIKVLEGRNGHCRRIKRGKEKREKRRPYIPTSEFEYALLGKSFSQVYDKGKV